MSETTELLESPASGEAPKRPRRGTGLSGMVLAELQSLASELGVSGTGKMRKSDLIAAIQERRGGSGASSAPAAGSTTDSPTSGNGAQSAPVQDRVPQDQAASQNASEPSSAGQTISGRRAGQNNAGRYEARHNDGDQHDGGQSSANAAPTRSQPARAEVSRQSATGADGPNFADSGDRPESADNDETDNPRRSSSGGQNKNRQNSSSGGQNNQANRNNQRSDANDRNLNDDDEDSSGSGGGRRRRRGRDRFRDREGNRQGGAGTNNQQSNRNNQRERYNDNEPQVSEDDVLIPIAGILDVLDNYAFVRTSGYLTGSNDVYVSLSQVRRYGLRRGDALTGAVKQAREGERREKFNALVRLDTINGLDPDKAKNRPEFTKLTPLYPQTRLRLETTASQMTTRVIDLVMPIGKGQRALIVSPPKAGKTMVLQAIANAITTNNPECHLMVVLVDERPEEVTDMQRSVKGEVIASTFDRPPSDHTTVAELAIERAKRLVELGHDVVVLLDSITRLGRAYNLAAPTSGRILSGGVDSTALYPPKRFLGAARNIENGGSLTIIATALVETGSTMDTVIFEEFKGTGNAELKLDRRIADKRVFPAIDVDPSGTRKEEILLPPDELAVVIKLRRVLHALEPQAALDLLLDRLRKTQNNAEFLMGIAKSAPGDD